MKKNNSGWIIFGIVLVLAIILIIYFVGRGKEREDLSGLDNMVTDVIDKVEFTTSDAMNRLKEAFPEITFDEASTGEDFNIYHNDPDEPFSVILTKANNLINSVRINIGYQDPANREKVLATASNLIDSVILPTIGSTSDADKAKIMDLTKDIFAEIDDGSIETGNISVRTHVDNDTVIVSHLTKDADSQETFYEIKAPYYLEYWVNYMPASATVIEEGKFEEIKNGIGYPFVE